MHGAENSADEQLGLYFNATRLYALATGLLIGTFSTVSMPALARLQDDLPRFRSAFAKACRFVSLVACPAFAGLSVVSEDAIAVVLGERWAGSAPVLQLLALVGIIHPIQYINGAAMTALGRPGIRLRLHALLALLNVSAYCIAVPHGIVAVAAAYALVAYLWSPVETLVNRWLGAVSLAQLFRAVYAQILATAIMAAGTWFLRTRLLAETTASQRLLVCSLAGASIYVAAALLLDRRLWFDSLDLIRYFHPTSTREHRKERS